MTDDFSPLPGCEVHYLRSTSVGDEFKVLVGHCASPEGPPTRMLLTLDPWAGFGTAVETVRMLAFSGDIAPTLVVAVGYRDPSIPANLVLRSRDLTPTSDEHLAALVGAPALGGAPAFLAFLRDELLPWLRERYGVHSDATMFFGDSFGGLFGTYVLLTDPTVFSRYGLGSPSYWWDKHMMFDLEASYAAAHDDLPARVFVSIGAYETPAGDVRWREQLSGETRVHADEQAAADAAAGYGEIDMVAASERMVATLRGRNYPGLTIDFEVLPGEYHQTAGPLNLSRALRHLYDAPL